LTARQICQICFKQKRTIPRVSFNPSSVALLEHYFILLDVLAPLKLPEIINFSSLAISGQEIKLLNERWGIAFNWFSTVSADFGRQVRGAFLCIFLGRGPIS
jgi:hypothetical protein